MRTRILRKATAFILAASMMVSMAGCGKGSGGSDTNTSTRDMIYAAEPLNIEGYEGELSGIYVLGEKIYITTYEWLEDENAREDSSEGAVSDDEEKETEEEEAEGTSAEDGAETGNGENTEAPAEEGGAATESEGTEAGDEETEISDDESVYGTTISRMYSMNLDGSDLKEITLPEVGDNAWMNQMFVSEDGGFTYVYSSYDEKKNRSMYFRIKADENGKMSVNEDITDVLNIDEESNISRILMDTSGNLVFVQEKAISVINSENKLICELKSEDNRWLEGATITKDGQIIVGSSGEEHAYVQMADLEGKKWGEKYDLDIRYFSSSDSLMTGDEEYDFYYKNDSGIYGYFIADKKSTKILDYLASNISSNSTYGIQPLTEGKFISNSYNSDGKGVLYVYSKVEPSTIVDKEVITLTMTWADDDTKDAAMEFNKNNDKYQIEIRDYSDIEDDPATKMNADIIAGNVGDIICLDNLPVKQYVAKGMLEDLTPYFEKDNEVKMEDMIDSLREAALIDGKMYYIVPNFRVHTLIASTEDVGTMSGWTFGDMKRLLDQKGDSARPFYSENKENMLYALAGNASTDFVDWSTGECSFDSQDFKDILEICNRGTNEEQVWSEDSPSMPSLIQDGRVLFAEGALGLDEIQVYKHMFKGDINFIGYPDEEKEGSYFTINNPMGIYSKSKLKDGAWEFIRTFMTKEYQGKQESIGYSWTIPSRKDALELKLRIAMATEKFTDEYGGEHEPVQSGWSWDDFETDIKPTSQEEADLYMDLINNTKKVSDWNSDILEIIIDESKAYFQGDKSLDETVNIIQNRVKTYVNESR